MPDDQNSNVPVLSPKTDVSTTTSLELIEVLANPGITLSEVATGVFASKSELPLIGARLVQAMFKGNLRIQLGRELKDLHEKGKIKEDYFASNDAQATLHELLDFIDSENIADEERLKAMKKIFFYMISPDINDADRPLAYQLLQISKELRGVDILVLKTVYYLRRRYHDIPIDLVRDKNWGDVIAVESGLKFSSLIVPVESKLNKLGVINNDNYDIRTGGNYGLTGLGEALCEYILRSED